LHFETSGIYWLSIKQSVIRYGETADFQIIVHVSNQSQRPNSTYPTVCGSVGFAALSYIPACNHSKIKVLIQKAGWNVAYLADMRHWANKKNEKFIGKRKSAVSPKPPDIRPPLT